MRGGRQGIRVGKGPQCHGSGWSLSVSLSLTRIFSLAPTFATPLALECDFTLALSLRIICNLSLQTSGPRTGTQQEWEGFEFTCKAWKDTGTYILAEIDEIQQLMDDQIVKTQAMRGSR